MSNKRKKVFSKWMAVCIALIMTISMALPVQAKVEEGTKYSLTVTGKETDKGAAVDVYKLIDINFDTDKQQPVEPFYVWETVVAEWLKGNGHQDCVGEGNRVTNAYVKLESGAFRTLMNEIEDAIAAGNLELTPSGTETLTENNYQLAFQDLELGVYLIRTTADPEGEHSDYEYAPAVANIVPVFDEKATEGEWIVKEDATKVVIKGTPTSITKDVNDHTTHIGQVLDYTLEVPVPSYPEDAVEKIFRIGDKLPKGISFEKELAANKLSVFAVYADGDVKIDKIAAKEEAEEDTIVTYHFEAVDNGAGGIESWTEGMSGDVKTFILDFDYDKLTAQYGEQAGKVLKGIRVTYQGAVNEFAYEGGDVLLNTAYVGQNNPYDASDYQTKEDQEKVYTYEIEVLKVGEDGTTPLSGAEFKLFEDEEMKTERQFVKTGDGEYRLAKQEEKVEEVLAVGTDGDRLGKLNLKGLETGTYYLKETKAPEGYQVKEELIVIEITDSKADDENYDYGENPIQGAGHVDETESNVVYETVVNTKPPIMPVTGGIGTILFSVVGIIFVAGGIMLIAGYQKKKHR